MGLSRRLMLSVLGGLAMAGPVLAEAPVPRETAFNDAGFDWYSYDDGLRLAAEQGRMVFVVVQTDWCPHCNELRGAFGAPDVVAHAGDFVFVLIDRDEEAELSARLAPDGDYIPRVLVLDRAGVIQRRLAPMWFGPVKYTLRKPYEKHLPDYLGWLVDQPEMDG
jgi:thiol-disulfide isomerase/thioredoxin